MVKKAFFFLAPLFLLLLASKAQAQPLSADSITAALKQGLPTARVSILVTQRGVDFELTKDVEGKLRSAGADDQLIAVIRKFGERIAKQRKEKEEETRKKEKERAAGIDLPPRSPGSRISPGLKEIKLVDLGKQLLDKKDYQGALKAAETALEINPEYEIAWVVKGDTLVRLKRLPEALESYDKALIIDDKDPRTSIKKAVVLRDLSRFEEALQSVDRALSLSPANRTALYVKAQLLQRLRLYEVALDSIDKALEKDPKDDANGLLWLIRGDVLANMGRCGEARASYNRALNHDRGLLAVLGTKDAILKECERKIPSGPTT